MSTDLIFAMIISLLGQKAPIVFLGQWIKGQGHRGQQCQICLCSISSELLLTKTSYLTGSFVSLSGMPLLFWLFYVTACRTTTYLPLIVTVRNYIKSHMQRNIYALPISFSLNSKHQLSQFLKQNINNVQNACNYCIFCQCEKPKAPYHQVIQEV